MRDGVVHLHVEGRSVAGVGSDVLLGFGREEIMGVLGRAACSAIVGDYRSTLGSVCVVLPHPAVEIILGGTVVQVAIKRVVPVQVRQAAGVVNRWHGVSRPESASAGCAESPFTEHGRVVAGL